MGEVSTIGLDIAKSVFRFTGWMRWAVVIRRRVTRAKVLEFFRGLFRRAWWDRRPVRAARQWSRKLQVAWPSR